ncbi:MAG: hypothetical protein CM1200mP14_13580 [Gammaproteobacteria bacterium]|nr:MAG: hypothetical protein CM1200mP14_13580 [Gammaproteobacteria bacterium]GIT52120.1 MAG: hypothetical protein Ct9H300mP15_23330 [Gemmatimonadota bacterium]
MIYLVLQGGLEVSLADLLGVILWGKSAFLAP